MSATDGTPAREPDEELPADDVVDVARGFVYWLAEEGHHDAVRAFDALIDEIDRLRRTVTEQNHAPICPRCGLPEDRDGAGDRLFPQSSPWWICKACISYDAWCEATPNERLVWAIERPSMVAFVFDHEARIEALARTNPAEPA